MAISLECQRCTACCRWPGQVRLSETEISRLAAFLEMTETDFIQGFTRLRADRRGLALMDQSDGSCIFLRGNDCAVQKVKPDQCRGFPNRWNFPGFELLCHATPREVTAEEFEQRVGPAAAKPSTSTDKKKKADGDPSA